MLIYFYAMCKIKGKKMYIIYEITSKKKANIILSKNTEKFNSYYIAKQKSNTWLIILIILVLQIEILLNFC